MVVLSAAITSKSSTLVARQFVEMTRIRVQGLLSAFLKLIDNGGKDHTYIETESVRYVYQPIEALFILLITNKQSNILEDLETIRLLGLIAQDVCQDTVTEELVLQNAFNLVFAFDEVISFGYRESVALAQIKSYTEMDSFEEKYHTVIRQGKEQQEKKRRDIFAKKLDAERSRKPREERLRETEIHQLLPPTNMSFSPQDYEISEQVTSSLVKSMGPSSGMRLSTKKKHTELGEPQVNLNKAIPDSLRSQPPAAEVESFINEPLSVNIVEKVAARLQLDGGVESLTVEGAMQIVINNAAQADVAALHIEEKDDRFKFLVHPSMNKAEHAKGTLQLKDPSSPFQNHSTSTLLKWRLAKQSEELLPIIISCWPSPVADGTSVTIELELANLEYPLHDVHLQVMSPSQSNLTVSTLSNGYIEEDDITLHWKVPFLDKSSPSGVLEYFTSMDSSSIFPLTIEAVSDSSLCNIKVLDSFNMKTREPLSMHVVNSTNFTFAVG